MSKGKTICTVCNYIFDETVGEPRQKVSPEVKFEELPDGWRCPDCGSSKDMFQPCSCAGLPMEETRAGSGTSSVQTGSKKALVRSLCGVSVGQLVAEHPERACVLEQYGIDYCCGGKKTLEEACSQKGLRVEEVFEKFLTADGTALSPSEPDWTKTSLEELIEHIVAYYHQPLRQELPRLTQLAEKVAKVHSEKHPEMIELFDVFKSFRDQLELHMQKEELILFPGISGIEEGGGPKSFGCGGGIEHPIEVMTQEHDDAGQAISTMRRLTNNYMPPADACNTFKVLLHSLAKLESEMHQHVHKENNILFPRALALARSALARK